MLLLRRQRECGCGRPHMVLLLWAILILAQGSLGQSFSTPSSSSSSIHNTFSNQNNKNDCWHDIPAGAPDAILGIAAAFAACGRPEKVNVCVGAYKDEHGQSWVLPSVRAAEHELLADRHESKDYLPIEGDVVFVKKALQFAYGGDDSKDNDGSSSLLSRIAGVQSLSGTGACRIGGTFLARFWPHTRTIYIPTPTWGNHWKIFSECGLTTASYRYYDYQTNRLDLPGLLADLEQAPDGSIVLLHACAHNPTGCDPTLAEWQQIVDVLERKGHCAFFDSAYQGFASGNAEHDAAAFRSVVQRGSVPVLLAQSFAKNFGLYGERCGTLSVVCQSPAQRDRVMSQLRLIIRPIYSSPPRHGSSIVKTILSDPDLTAQYYAECAHMARRIQSMRQALVAKLAQVGSKHDWSHVTSQIGMFAYTGMSAAMCDALTEQYAIYLTRDGRISVAGLNESNLDYVARAIHDVTDGKSITGNEGK